MSREHNYYVEGKYKNKKIRLGVSGKEKWLFGLTKSDVASYTVLDEFNVEKFPGLMPIGVVGVALYGATAKEYLVSIEWKDGENSVILLDDEYYKVFVLNMV